MSSLRDAPWPACATRLVAAACVAISLVASSFALHAASGAARDTRTPAARFDFGKPPSAAQIAAWDIDVRPDGRGLPEGRGTVAQGQVVYDAQCASCHGTFGESNDYMAIAGGVGTLGSDQPMRTTASKLNHATTLWDYINRAMPFQNPKSLSPDEVYALTAYVLHLSDILPADAALDRESIVKLKLPNRDGFTTDHGLMSIDGRPDTNNVACMRDCAGEVLLASEMPEHARGAHGDLARQMRSIGPMEGVQLANADATPTSTPSGAGTELAKASGCTLCHGVTNRVIGPGFREIEHRYAGEAGAQAKLVERVRSGGAGAWGPVPMPAQPQLAAADAEALVRWILAGAR